MKKKFIPNKYICYLYLLIPLIVNAMLLYQNDDIWYIMRYGKIILESGFIHTDMLSMHNGLHIVIQQPLTCIIFHLIYKCLGGYGIFLLIEILIALYLFFIYKICMLLSNKNLLLSIIISVITCLLLELDICARPQLFTFLHLLIIIYIMEVFYKNNKTKLIYFLPLISLFQINLHGALWYFIFLFILPYIVQLIIEKNRAVYKIIVLMIVMFLVGFINPYTYENVFFPILTYDSSINVIEELRPFNITNINSLCFFILFALVILIYIYYKKGKLELRHLFLFGGTSILAFVNVRSIPVFIIGTIPTLSNYLKTINFKLRNEYVNTKKYWFIMIIFILIIAGFNTNRLLTLSKGAGDYLNKTYNKSIVLYANINTGSYFEYLGFHPYFDTRAEVYTKKANKKEDLFTEAMLINESCYNYRDFMKKYNFTHLVVYRDNCLYNYLKNDEYKIIYEDKYYAIFESNDERINYLKLNKSS